MLNTGNKMSQSKIKAKAGHLYRHLRTGNIYLCVCENVLHTETEETLVVYSLWGSRQKEALAHQAKRYARPKSMFEDGRFEELKS